MVEPIDVSMTNAIKRFPWLETALLLGYAAIGAMAVGHHVLWRDESVHWLVARYSGTFADLLISFRSMRPHLLPWHALLWAASKASHSVSTVQVVHLALATAAVAVFIYFSPFRLLDKALFCFGYFPLFEYCVICRPYVLIWLAMFGFCAVYCRQRRNLLVVGAMLFLLGNTELDGAVMAAAIIAGLTVEFWGRRDVPYRLPAFCLACLGVLMTAAQVFYAMVVLPNPYYHGSPIFHGEAMRIILGTLQCPWCTFAVVPAGFPHWPTFFWGYNAIDWFRAGWLVSLLSVVMIVVLALTVRGPARWAWLAGCAFTIGLSLLQTGELSLRHWGLLFILYIACRWIDRSPSRRPAWHAKLLTALLVVQAVAGVYAWSAERTRPFSGAKGAADIIRSNHWENLLILGETADELASVRAYLDRDIYYIDYGDWSRVPVYWFHGPPVEIGRAMATTCRMVEESGTNAVLILNDMLATGDAVLALDKPGGIMPVTLPDGRIARFKISVAGLTAGTVGGENYTLYLIEREGSLVSPSMARIILNPDDAKAHNNLGTVLGQLGKLEEAIGQYEQAVRMKPDYADAHFNLGLMLSDQGRVPEAIGHYEQALRVKPDYADAHYSLGNALQLVGRLQDAIAHFEQALEIKPDYAEAHFNLALAFRQVGKLDEAIHHYERAVQIKPDYAEAHNNLGNALLQAGKMEDAIGQFEQALRIMPDYAVAHYNLGAALAQTGKTEEAIPHYEQALRIMPDYAMAHQNLGVALARTGKIKEAIPHFEQALRIMPDYAMAHYNLGAALAQTGKTEEAIAHFEQALRIKPDFAEAQDGLARLQAAQ